MAEKVDRLKPKVPKYPNYSRNEKSQQMWNCGSVLESSIYRIFKIYRNINI